MERLSEILKSTAGLPGGLKPRPEGDPGPADPTSCPWCDGRGIRLVRSRSSGDIVEEACICESGKAMEGVDVRAVRLDEAFRRLLLGLGWDDYLEAKLLDFPTSLRSAVQDSLNNGRGLYLSGEPGRGKTRLAVAGLRLLAERGMSYEAIVIPQWLGSIWGAIDEVKAAQAEGRHDAPGPERITNYPVRFEALLIDDLGSERETEAASVRIFRLIDQRARRGALTIITANYALPKLAGRFGGDGLAGRRIASRIHGLCDQIEVTGQDRRIQKVEML